MGSRGLATTPAEATVIDGASGPGLLAEPTNALRLLIDTYLETLWSASDAPPALVEGMRYALLGGGKRIRPMLALATAEVLGHEPCDVLPIAAALEMIHTNSLIHDDLPAMDDADLRRGQPTCHRRYGEGIAILLGDVLFAEAIALVVNEQRGTPARVHAALKPILQAAASEGMAGGQFLDLTGADNGDPAVFTVMNDWKTSSLFRAAVLSVAAWAGSRRQTTEALDRYATALGQLFQLRDDVLDVIGAPERVGKSTGADKRNKRATYVAREGGNIETLQPIAASLHAQALNALACLPRAPDVLVAIVDFAGQRDY
jgi:geranylgeranyl diphosphate synthase type II